MDDLIIATHGHTFQWEPCGDNGPLPPRRGWYLFTVRAHDKLGVVFKFYPGSGATLKFDDNIKIVAWAGPISLPPPYRGVGE